MVRILAVVTVAALLASCGGGEKNPNDKSKPTVEIKVRQPSGEYAQANEASLAKSGGSLQLMCVVSDPEGISGWSLEYQVGNATACIVNGALNSGSFLPQGEPTDKSQTFNSGNLTLIPVFDTIDTPLSCKTGPSGDPGVASDYNVTVTFKGSNWSSDPANKTNSAVLKVHVG